MPQMTQMMRQTPVPVRIRLPMGGMACLFGMTLVGCKDVTGAGALPAGTPNPAVYNSASGARGLRTAAVFSLEAAVPTYVVESGLLSDELEDRLTGASAGTLLSSDGLGDPLDERILPEGIDPDVVQPGSYMLLQQARGSMNLAIHALAAYDTAPADTAHQHVLRGELYALEGYTEILLADFFCSGVPLSTLDFQGDFTYQPGSSTAAVYRDALAKLDSALTLARSTDSVVNLARVLRGRAYLDLGHPDSAALAVAAVPPDFQYTLVTTAWGGQFGRDGNLLTARATVSDQEGETGLPYRSSGDPRSATKVVCIPNTFSDTLYDPQFCRADTLTFPIKYDTGQSGTNVDSLRPRFVVANGIEAQLIEAEAALAAGDGSWLTTLNTLRTSIGLGTLADPGTPAGRISLIFAERAEWLFLTGHRQGDLRRLLRQYGPQYPEFRSQDQVYPTGLYTAPGQGVYGTAVTAPIPPAETINPDFHGCLDRNP